MQDAGFKQCPFCKEKIRTEAVKCRFCGEWLEQASAIFPDSQKKTEASILPPFPKPAESPMPDKTENKTATPKRILKEVSQKTLFWISVSLLTVCCLLWVLGFASGHWSQLSPAKQGEAIGNIIVGMIKIFFVAGLVSWGIKDKTEKLLAFSVVIAVSTAIGAYYFHVGRQEAQQKARESDTILASNINNLEGFIKGGATGDIPEFKPTGDADTDTFFQTTRDFYAEYFQGWRKAGADIEALQEMSISDCLLFTNKFYLEPQIQDRIAGQQVIEGFRTNALSMIENYKQKCAALNVTEEYKQGILKSLDKMSPQFEAMFDANIKSQKTDQALLQFLHDNFEDYEFKDGTILFATAANRQKYDELAKDVQDASSEVDGFQKRGLAAIEAAKLKLQ
jgi:hypothetical protein